MSVLKLKKVHDDIMEAVRFANVHMDIAMPQWLKNHANVNTQTLSRLRDTDADASRLAEFRHSIKHNRAEDGSEGTGADDYASMVDKLISKSGLIKPYGGPGDFRDFAELKNLKAQLRAVVGSRDLEGAWDAATAMWKNKGLQAMISVSTLTYTQAVTEIESTIGTEVTPAIRDAIIEGIVTEYNGVCVEFNGEKITVDEMKAYIKEARS